MKERYARRIDLLRALASSAGLNFVVVVPGTNLYYLTGVEMHMSERATLFIIPVEGEPAWFAPLLELEKLKNLSGVDRGWAWNDSDGPVQVLADATAQLGLSSGSLLGCEYRGMRLLEWELLQRVLPDITSKNIGPLMAELRQKKDAFELGLMEKAVAIAQEALDSARKALVPGVTERQIADLIRLELMKRGSVSAFGPSVAFGPNSGLPHSQVSDRVLATGDLVWIDMGAVYEGYCSDITRTFPVGDVSDELRRVYAVVHRAQKTAREEARPGMTATGVDALCRDIITEAGYGEYFTHRTGHGLGLDVHEEPYMVAGSELVLEPGMVFTLEPGIYLPGRGGVRIEDDVVVTDSGVRSLTTYRRNWL